MPKIKRFTSAGLLTLTTIALGVTAYAASAQNDERPNQPPVTAAPAALPGIRAQSIEMASIDPNVQAAKDSSIIACMAEAGHSYTPEQVTRIQFDPDLVSGLLPLSVETAAASGYDTVAHTLPPADAGSGNPPTAVEGISAAPQNDAYTVALMGRPDAPQEVVPFGDGGSIGASTQGCLAEAAREVYGSVRNQLLVEGIGRNLPLEAIGPSNHDRGLLDATADWSACMIGKERTFATPGEAMMAAATMPRMESIKVAMDDAECREQVQLHSKRASMQDRYLTTVFERNADQIAEIQKVICQVKAD